MRDVRACTNGGAEADGMFVGAWARGAEMAQVRDRGQGKIGRIRVARVGTRGCRGPNRSDTEECGAMCNERKWRDGWTRRLVGAVEGENGITGVRYR